MRSVKLQFCRRWQAGTKSLTSLTALQSRARLRSRCGRHVMLDWRRCTPQQNVGTWRHLWVWLGGRIPNKGGMSSVDHVDSRSRDPWGDRLVPFWIQKTHENTEREREYVSGGFSFEPIGWWPVTCQVVQSLLQASADHTQGSQEGDHWWPSPRA